MRYCTRCVLPDTRPNLSLDAEGVCNACRAHRHKRDIDWAQRRRELERLVTDAKQRRRGYDAVIPVSGGKDSTWQVVTCLELGLRLLAVTWRTPSRTAIGQRNLDNLIGLGVDHIDYAIDPRVERKLAYNALTKTGSVGVPMHLAIYAIPLRVAVAFDVPLVVWGENPYVEYGGSRSDLECGRWDHAAMQRHGILQGTAAEDWIDDDLTAKALEPYFMPPPEALDRRGIRSVLLGHYLDWDPAETRRVAVAHGFQADPDGPRVGLYDYADIDCHFIAVHHHFKWLKFGFTRLFDNLALEIRHGRMTRHEAVEVIAARGDQTPHEDIGRLCSFLEISPDEYGRIEERFRNRDIWKRANGHWQIEGFLIKDWKWS